MRFKKPRGLLLGIGFGTFVIGVALFFLVPVFFKDGFAYNGLSVLLEGVKELVHFNFANVLYTALVVLFVFAVAIFVTYLALVVKNKYRIHVITWFFSFVAIFGSYVFVSSYFLASVTFNNVENVKLLDAMLKTDGQMIGKILSSLSLALVLLSNVVLIVHVFVSLVAMMVTDQIDKFEKKAKEENEALQAKMAEIEATVPARAKEPVAVVEVTSEDLIKEATFEERKAKEDKLFKECLDSGYFTEYEEIEFPDEVEGFDEEPVCEYSVVEEKSSIIRKSTVHVGFSHE